MAIGVGIGDCKEVLGIWLEQTEGVKFWLKVITELNNRGVEDILIACVDGLKGFPVQHSTNRTKERRHNACEDNVTSTYCRGNRCLWYDDGDP